LNIESSRSHFSFPASSTNVCNTSTALDESQALQSQRKQCASAVNLRETATISNEGLALQLQHMQSMSPFKVLDDLGVAPFRAQQMVLNQA
jgi:hypothetical protein